MASLTGKSLSVKDVSGQIEMHELQLLILDSYRGFPPLQKQYPKTPIWLLTLLTLEYGSFFTQVHRLPLIIVLANFANTALSIRLQPNQH